MKVKIEQVSNGFIVEYNEDRLLKNYVYKATDDLLMWEEIAKAFLKRRIKIEEK